MYIPYGSQTFLRKRDLIPMEYDVKGLVWELGCRGGGMGMGGGVAWRGGLNI
jgi:hypothetical protein